MAARIGLVLGAGGVTGGAFHAGVLSAVAEETGWDPRTAELLVGTSAGSVTAAGLRAGLSAADMAARALGEPLSAEGRALLEAAGVPIAPPPPPGGARVRFGLPAAPEVLVAALRRPWQVRPSALMAGLLPAGTVETDAIVEGMNALHRYGWPAAAMWVCAVRVRDGGLVVFGRDGAPPASVGAAVAASCAIPGYFAPVDIGGIRYVDGGAHSLTNIGEVAGLGLDLVIVSAPMSRVGRLQLSFELPRVQRSTPVVAFQPTPADQRVMGVNAMDPSRRAAVVSQVRESTRARLDQVLGRHAHLLGA